VFRPELPWQGAACLAAGEERGWKVTLLKWRQLLLIINPHPAMAAGWLSVA